MAIVRTAEQLRMRNFSEGFVTKGHRKITRSIDTAIGLSSMCRLNSKRLPDSNVVTLNTVEQVSVDVQPLATN